MIFQCHLRFIPLFEARNIAPFFGKTLCGDELSFGQTHFRQIKLLWRWRVNNVATTDTTVQSIFLCLALTTVLSAKRKQSYVSRTIISHSYYLRLLSNLNANWRPKVFASRTERTVCQNRLINAIVFTDSKQMYMVTCVLG